MSLASRIGRLFQSTVAIGIQKIRNQWRQNNIQRYDKIGSRSGDFFTPSDIILQQFYEEFFSERFPNLYLLGEEDTGYTAKSTSGSTFITIDGIDGTRNFASRANFGVGTQLALVQNGLVTAACIGDVVSGDIFSFYPGQAACVIKQNGHKSLLPKVKSEPLAKQPMLMRHDSSNFDSPIRQLVESGFIANRQIKRFGGIGVTLGELWLGKVGSFVLKASKEAPWDICPAYSIAEQAGMVFLKPTKDNSQLELWQPRYSNQKQPRPHSVLITHKSKVSEIQAALVA